MKKYFVLTLALLFALSLPVASFAGGWTPPSTKATANPIAGPAGTADSASATSWFGNPSDDTANARGGSTGTAENQSDAGILGWGKAKAEGEANVNGSTHAFAIADDAIGSFLAGQPTSFSAAGITTKVTADANGYSKAYGLGIAGASNVSEGTVDGQVDQNTYAGEINYPGGTSASAGQTSGATFSGKAYDADYGAGLFCADANSGIDMTGSATAGGESFVTIDNKGSYQSATAQTANFATADVVGDDKEFNTAYGNGGVGIDVLASKGSSGGYAGGNASFSYNGVSLGQANGQGSAVMSGYVDAGNHSISVHSEGAAQSSNF